MDALNEIVVRGSNRAAWLEVKIFYNHYKKISNLVGDGIIFATQIGSTAYNLFAGGPVLLNDNLSVTPINALIQSNYFLPHTKSLVAPLNACFEVVSQRGDKFLPYVSADGQRDYRLKRGDKVIINVSNLKTKLIELK